MAQRRNGHPLRQDRPKQPDGVVDVTNAAYSNYGLKRLMFDLAQQVGPTVLWFYMITLSGHKYQYTYLQKRDCPECFFFVDYRPALCRSSTSFCFYDTNHAQSIA